MAKKPRKPHERRNVVRKLDGDVMFREPVWIPEILPQRMDVTLAYNAYHQEFDGKDSLRFAADHFRKRKIDDLADFLEQYDISDRFLPTFGFLCRMMDRGLSLGPENRQFYDLKVANLRSYLNQVTSGELKIQGAPIEIIYDDEEEETEQPASREVGSGVKALKKIRRRRGAGKDPTIQKGPNYLEIDEDTRLESIPPVRINRSSVLWIYNKKYALLGYYKAPEGSKLSLKGTTVHNVSTSFNKTMRDVKGTLTRFMAAKNEKERQSIYDTINGKAKHLRTRLNEHVLLLTTSE